MDMQWLVVWLLVLASAAYVLQAQWPGAVRRLRVACALWLLRAPRGPLLNALGRWVAPRARASDCTGCAGGCSRD